MALQLQLQCSCPKFPGAPVRTLQLPGSFWPDSRQRCVPQSGSKQGSQPLQRLDGSRSAGGRARAALCAVAPACSKIAGFKVQKSRFISQAVQCKQPTMHPASCGVVQLPEKLLEYAECKINPRD